MTAQKPDFKAVALRAKSELDLVVRTVKEKGAKRFSTALMIAGAMILMSHVFIYSPPKKRLATLGAEIERRRSLADSGGQYKAIRESLHRAYKVLPTQAEREQWLSAQVIDSLRVENLTAESFQPPTEEDSAGVFRQSSRLSVTMRFAEFFSWLQRIETMRPMMHVHQAELKKDKGGRNVASFQVVTLIPKRRYE